MAGNTGPWPWQTNAARGTVPRLNTIRGERPRTCAWPVSELAAVTDRATARKHWWLKLVRSPSCGVNSVCRVGCPAPPVSVAAAAARFSRVLPSPSWRSQMGSPPPRCEPALRRAAGAPGPLSLPVELAGNGSRFQRAGSLIHCGDRWPRARTVAAGVAPSSGQSRAIFALRPHTRPPADLSIGASCPGLVAIQSSGPTWCIQHRRRPSPSSTDRS